MILLAFLVAWLAFSAFFAGRRLPRRKGGQARPWRRGGGADRVVPAAPPSPSAQRGRALTCDGCNTASDRDARYWTAFLATGEERTGSTGIAVYCPRCAETHFQFFSQRRNQLSD